MSRMAEQFDQAERLPRLLFRPEEVAEITGYSPSWLQKKASAGEIPCNRTGRKLMFTRAHIDEIVRLGDRPARGRRSA